MKTVSRSSKLVVSAVAVLLVMALGAAAALGVTAAEQTRETYVAQVEPICKTNTETVERLLGNVRKEIKQGKLKLAGTQFTQAATAGSKSVKQIKGVPQPPADVTKLKKWIGLLEGEQKLLGEIGSALKAGNKFRANNLSVRVAHNGNLANNAVLGFEFDHCLIDSSKFS